ncbi:MAG: hypothetical protein E7086_08120 [Bacteroidales bacterium]|nr:hypothetical protein [Bacteroidales bacterium]
MRALTGLKAELIHIRDGDKRVAELRTNLMLVYGIYVVVIIIVLVLTLCRVTREECNSSHQHGRNAKKSFHSYLNIILCYRIISREDTKKMPKACTHKVNIRCFYIFL